MVRAKRKGYRQVGTASAQGALELPSASAVQAGAVFFKRTDQRRFRLRGGDGACGAWLDWGRLGRLGRLGRDGLSEWQLVP